VSFPFIIFSELKINQNSNREFSLGWINGEVHFIEMSFWRDIYNIQRFPSHHLKFRIQRHNQPGINIGLRQQKGNSNDILLRIHRESSVCMGESSNMSSNFSLLEEDQEQQDASGANLIVDLIPLIFVIYSPVQTWYFRIQT